MKGRIVLRSGCKINLWLYILGRRPDGRHDLDTLFFALPEPHDEIVLEPGGEDFSMSWERAPGGPPLPEIDPRRNTLCRAWEVFGQASGFQPGLKLHLVKGVPGGAGLGGGSADAAVLLRWLNREAEREGKALDARQLAAAGLSVGADVPFFLQDRPCRGRGLGEVLEPCDAVRELGLAGRGLLLLCPDVPVSTAWAYAAWDECQGLTGRLPQGMQEASRIADSLFSGGIPWLFNSFEAPVFLAGRAGAGGQAGTAQTGAGGRDGQDGSSSRLSLLPALKDELLRAGALAAVMSGSGSSLFAIFGTEEIARRQEAAFRERGVAAYSHVL